jgi:ubiquitin carboxyl-terminal hydrolase 25/28
VGYKVYLFTCSLDVVLAHLSDLFTQMACASANAITPSIELAKLALVTSKDEEEDAAKTNPQAPEGTSSSASTDATLVEDTNATHQVTLATDVSIPASTSTSSSTQPNPAKILGKRSREAETSGLDGDTSPDVGMTTPHKVRSPRREDSSPPDKTMRVDGPSEINLDSEGIELEKPANADEDTSMDDVEVSSVIVTAPVSQSGSPTTSRNALPATETRNQPPPLPKRQPPPLPPRKQPISDSTMMFGE